MSLVEQAADTEDLTQGENLLRLYREKGYCVVRGVIDNSTLDTLFGDMMSPFAHQLRHHNLPIGDWRDPSAVRSNLLSLFNADMEAYLAAARLSQYLPNVLAFSISKPVLTLLRQLAIDEPVIATKPVCHYMNDDLSVPDGYHKAPAHQDWRSMQGSLDGCIVWMPLVDIDENSYPLELVPGSHAMGLLETTDHPATPVVVDERISDNDFEPVLVKRGELVVISGFTVHRTGNTGDARVRVAVSCRYNNAAEPTFISRGYASPYRHSYDRALLVENFPSKDEIRTVYPERDATAEAQQGLYRPR